MPSSTTTTPTAAPYFEDDPLLGPPGGKPADQLTLHDVLGLVAANGFLEEVDRTAFRLSSLSLTDALLGDCAANKTHGAKRRTRLMAACKVGSAQRVQWWLDRGADPNAADSDGLTPLMWAAWYGHDGCVEALLNHGSGATTAAAGAARAPRASTKVGARVGAVDAKGGTALMKAAVSGSAACVRLLIAAGADHDATYSDGCTALHSASMQGKLHAVRALLAAGASVNARDGKGSTALSKAALKDHVDVVRALLDAGADKELLCNEGVSPLQYACWYGAIASVKELCARGADVESVDKKGGRAIMKASVAGSIPCLHELIKVRKAAVDARYSDGCTALSSAAWNGKVESVRFLLECGANVNARDSTDASPLHKAAEKGHAEIVRELLAAGADRNSLARGTTGRPAMATPLALAVRGGQPRTVAALVEEPPPRASVLAAAGLEGAAAASAGMGAVLVRGGRVAEAIVAALQSEFPAATPEVLAEVRRRLGVDPMGGGGGLLGAGLSREDGPVFTIAFGRDGGVTIQPLVRR
jgi:ankyrin repeat protein